MTSFLFLNTIISAYYVNELFLPFQCNFAFYTYTSTDMGKIRKFSHALLSDVEPIQLLPSDLLKWDLSTTAVILNAIELGEPGRTQAVTCSAASLRDLKSEAERTRRRNRAKAQYNKWLESKDVTSMPLGSARYIFEYAQKSSWARFGPLVEHARIVINHHNIDCPDHCKDLLHEGDRVPDVSVVMLSALDSAMSNFSRVTVTNPEVLYNAASLLDDGAGPSALGDLVTYAAAGSESTLDWTPSTDIYLLPQFIAQDESSMLDDMMVDQLMLGSPQKFGIERIKWLSTSKSTKEMKMSLSFTRVLQHWSVQEHISQQALTRLLKLMHFYRPTITINDYIDHRIPHTGRRLLSTSKTAQMRTTNDRRRTGPNDCTDFFEEHQCKVRTLFGPGLKSKDMVQVGRYAHFGLEKAILGTSIGLIHRYHYRNLLRRIHTVHPLLLPEMFLDLTRPESDEPFDRNTWYNWLTAKRPDMKTQEPIVFEVRINADGAQWFESSYVKGTPILGKITAVKTLSGSKRVKIPYHLGKPFVIGVFEHTTGKPAAWDLLKDTIAEMNGLHPDTLLGGGAREGESFAVEVTCFNCDAPMRSDLKGTKSCSGYYGCERCRTSGVYVPRSKMCIVKEIVQNSDGTTTTKWVKKLVPIEGKGTKRSSKQAEVQPPKETIAKRKRRLEEQDLGEGLENDDPAADASDEDEDAAAPFSRVRAGGAKKKQLEERSAAVRVPKRLVTRKKKQRTIEADEIPPETDEEEDGYESDDTANHVDSCNTVVNETSSAVDEATKKKKKKGKGKIIGGSTYFPEIGAEPRTDAGWSQYTFPEEPGVVSNYYLYLLYESSYNYFLQVHNISHAI